MNGCLGIAVVASALVTACPQVNEPGAANQQSGAKPKDGEALGPVERVRRASTSQMGAHFADVVEIHTTLIRGSLDDAKTTARALAEDRPDVMLEEWAPYLLDLRRNAEELGRARSLAEAAPLAATLAKSCGDCHEAQGVHLAPRTTVPPPKGDDDDARMRRHAWAFNRLWEGLVLPSDESWKLGVEAFVELPACEDRISVEADRAAIGRARETVIAAEQAARTAVSREARARIYGEMLPTCAACHAAGC